MILRTRSSNSFWCGQEKGGGRRKMEGYFSKATTAAQIEKCSNMNNSKCTQLHAHRWLKGAEKRKIKPSDSSDGYLPLKSGLRVNKPNFRNFLWTYCIFFYLCPWLTFTVMMFGICKSKGNGSAENKKEVLRRWTFSPIQSKANHPSSLLGKSILRYRSKNR